MRYFVGSNCYGHKPQQTQVKTGKMYTEYEGGKIQNVNFCIECHHC